jgi:hypothetical protein
MPATHLVWLEEWILGWLHADAQQSYALLATSYAQLLAGFARQEHQQICACLVSLETKGLIVVNRTPEGEPASLVLTPAGSQCGPHAPGLFDMEGHSLGRGPQRAGA